MKIKLLVICVAALQFLVFAPLVNSQTVSEEIRDIVEKKVEDALNTPKAYIGTITDISDTTLQIKNLTGEIKQISTKDPEITIVKTGKTVKEIKLNELAIGDFIAGLGYLRIVTGTSNGNSVLDAKRILVTDPLESPNRHSLLGKVSKLEKNKVTLDSSGKSTEVILSTTTKINSKSNDKIIKIKFSDLEEKDKLIVLGTTGDSSFEARTILRIETAPTPSPEVSE